MKQTAITITINYNKIRLDKALSEISNISRSKIQLYIKSGHVTKQDNIITDCKRPVTDGEIYYINHIEETSELVAAPEIKLDIIYEDDDVIVINKPAGLVVHPGAGNKNNTMANSLIAHYQDNLSQMGDSTRPGIVHRLDKDTSGLIIVAKNNQAHEHLSQQLSDRSLSREYIAVIWGTINPLSGTVNANIARRTHDRTKMTTVKSGGKIAITDYSTEEILLNGTISVIKCKLHTGRTHQIRVHMNHLGHPLIGDKTYMSRRKKICTYSEINNFPRQALHARKIGFIHPKTLQYMEFTKEPPDDIMNIIKLAQNHE
jgi:23S rRNA pseudouridine1911/1915/1917 synthase